MLRSWDDAPHPRRRAPRFCTTILVCEKTRMRAGGERRPVRCDTIMDARNLSCSALLGSAGTHDIPPIRASYAVMDHVARLAAKKSFVEIGSRHGDLIDCVSHVTSSAVTVERDRQYCPTLRRRATASKGRFTSLCASFSSKLDPMPSADIYFAWVPQYLNIAFLAGLQKQQIRGAVPRSARLALAFSDGGLLAEHLCWLSLRPFAESFTDVKYDERKPGELGKRGTPSRRRHGYTTVGVFVPVTLNMSAVLMATNRICQKGDAVSMA